MGKNVGNVTLGEKRNSFMKIPKFPIILSAVLIAAAVAVAAVIVLSSSKENKAIDKLLSQCDSVENNWHYTVSYSENTDKIFVGLHYNEKTEELGLPVVKETYSDICSAVFGDKQYSDSSVSIRFEFDDKNRTNCTVNAYQIGNITDSYDSVYFWSNPDNNITIDEIAESFPEISKLNAASGEISDITDVTSFENIGYIFSNKISADDKAKIEKLLPDCMVETSEETTDLPFEGSDVESAVRNLSYIYDNGFTLDYCNIYDKNTVSLRFKSLHEDFTFNEIYDIYTAVRSELLENKRTELGNSSYILNIAFEDNTPTYSATINSVEITCGSKGTYETQICIHDKKMSVSDFARNFPECCVLWLYSENMESVDDLFGFYDLKKVYLYADSERKPSEEEKKILESSYFDCEVTVLK